MAAISNYGSTVESCVPHNLIKLSAVAFPCLKPYFPRLLASPSCLYVNFSPAALFRWNPVERTVSLHYIF